MNDSDGTSTKLPAVAESESGCGSSVLPASTISDATAGLPNHRAGQFEISVQVAKYEIASPKQRRRANASPLR